MSCFRQVNKNTVHTVPATCAYSSVTKQAPDLHVTLAQAVLLFFKLQTLKLAAHLSHSPDPNIEPQPSSGAVMRTAVLRTCTWRTWSVPLHVVRNASGACYFLQPVRPTAPEYHHASRCCMHPNRNVLRVNTKEASWSKRPQQHDNTTT